MVRRFAFVLCLSPLSTASAAEPGCVDTLLLRDRTTVVAPCTQVLAAPDLSLETRVRSLEYRARGLLAGRRLDEAMRDIEAAIALAPDDPDLRVVRSSIHDNAGRMEEAWADAGEALDLAPDRFRALAHAIVLGLKAHAVDLVGDLLDHAEARHGRHVALVMYRASHEEMRGDLRRAVALLGEALAHPDAESRRAYGWSLDGHATATEAALLVQRGEMRAHLRDYDGGAEDLDAAVGVERSGIVLAKRARFNALRPGREVHLPAAYRDIVEALHLLPDDPYLHRVHGTVLALMKRPEDALKAYDAALSGGIDSASLWERGRIRRQLGDRAGASADFARAWRIDPLYRVQLVEKMQRYGYLERGPATEVKAEDGLDALTACSIDPECH